MFSRTRWYITRLEFTPLEFETRSHEAVLAYSHSCIRIYSVGVCNFFILRCASGRIQLEFTPLEFETANKRRYGACLKIRIYSVGV